MRYAYVDVGSYDGDSIEEFLEKKDLPAPIYQWDIYCFEPNPNLARPLNANLVKLANRFDLRADQVHANYSAAWISHGLTVMAIDKTNTPMGSTIIPTKAESWHTFTKKENVLSV